jgi:predicted acylesterase/phospholipase RssA
LWLPYFCVSTDITTGRTVSHRRGSLLRAVRASVAIPGVLPPVPDGGSLLVDGGVLNNLPMDTMREMNPAGIVIAVDVMSPRGPRAREDYGLSISGWRLMLSRLNPVMRTTAVPGLITTIMRSMFVGSAGNQERMLQDGLADLYLSIRAPGIGLLQFDNIPKTAQLGYDGSIESLTQWASQQRR